MSCCLISKGNNMNFFFLYPMFLRNLFLSFVLLFFISFPCLSMDTEDINTRDLPKMKFKLGFEFQEGSGLCPWALNDCRIQKKPLFEFKEKVEPQKTTEKVILMPLWHVVLDTSDIEFVTRPFAKASSLKIGLNTILTSLDSLRELLKDKKTITFKEWTTKLATVFNDEPFKIDYPPLFNSVENQPIIKPFVEWKPRFSPQVTIQHPLEYTIPLYFGLFGFKNPSHMMPFVASLPFRNLFLQFHEEANSLHLNALFGGYGKKISGLVFLHALTLVQMTPNEEDDDAGLLNETLKTFIDFQQIDAKMRLTLMSRRPFSSMFKDINIANININYAELFKKAMVDNNYRFSTFYKVPNLFHKTNYAEQFFDNETGKERPLMNFLSLFEEEFVETNREVLNKLLEKGIVSTTMLRNLKEGINEEINNLLYLLNRPEDYFLKFVDDNKKILSNLLERKKASAIPPGNIKKYVKTNSLLPFINNTKDYFAETINSIASPNTRYIIDADNTLVKKGDFSYDNLSPPWFLDLENSMGALKDDLAIDKSYGEAIVEIRGIKHVEDWFIKKVHLDSKIKGVFLTKPEQSLIQEAMTLFKFLENFGTSSDIEDIKLGITHSLFKH